MGGCRGRGGDDTKELKDDDDDDDEKGGGCWGCGAFTWFDTHGSCKGKVKGFGWLRLDSRQGVCSLWTRWVLIAGRTLCVYVYTVGCG